MKKITVFLCLLSVLLSCKNDDVDCSNFLPAPQEFYFTITDVNGIVLIGEEAQYSVSDIILLDDNMMNVIFENPSDDSKVGLKFATLQSQQSYTLKLGEEEDIVILNIKNGECGSRQIKDLTYNNVTYQSDEIGFFILIKK